MRERRCERLYFAVFYSIQGASQGTKGGKGYVCEKKMQRCVWDQVSHGLIVLCLP